MAGGTAIFDEQGYGRGEFLAIGVNLKLHFEPTGRGQNPEDKEPALNVSAVMGDGQLIPLGPAFRNRSRGQKTFGTEFFSCDLTDPGLPGGKLDLGMWPKDGEPGAYRIFWFGNDNRPQ